MTDSIKISVPAPLDRYNSDGSKAITSMEEWLTFFTEEECVEIIHRWCNSADAGKKYRQSAAEKNKALKAWAVKQGLDLSTL